MEIKKYYQNYKKYVTKQAVWKELDGIPDLVPIVTLSTCYGNNYTVKRFVVHGIMVNSK